MTDGYMWPMEEELDRMQKVSNEKELTVSYVQPSVHTDLPEIVLGQGDLASHIYNP